MLSPQTFLLQTMILVRLFHPVKGFAIEQKLGRKIAKIEGKNGFFSGVQTLYSNNIPGLHKKATFFTHFCDFPHEFLFNDQTFHGVKQPY